MANDPFTKAPYCYGYVGASAVIFEPGQASQLAERAERRTNLFVSAKLAWPQGYSPATIRNLSPSGALIEAAALPSPGVSIQLSRGSLRIEGEVIWCEGRRAGLKFTGRIAVADWLPRGSAVAQARVDEVVHAVKSGDTSNRGEAPVARMSETSGSFSEETAELQILLGLVAEGLAEDSLVLTRHGEKLQMLDMVRQRLVRLSGGDRQL